MTFQPTNFLAGMARDYAQRTAREYGHELALEPMTSPAPTPAAGAEYTGGSVSYYKVRVGAPLAGCDPYTAECNDIIEALGMNYAEGNAFKAIWRRCAARMGMQKRGYDGGLYDAEKVEFFGGRMVAQSKAQALGGGEE